ncbi:LysR family transcriptional regulator [Salipaludibacillus sp. CUR1]|uniref:LysR family transcriptional regulator n=1 Tax=Salipaludibacillus sp. CUR1 TaxID=2820003 RepID=UPI001E52E886|nr:LysR family transcriptional regulator [Salipaludibacillus sp. CUR1]MCE7792400.1 LysR family transcriptional regulator [Salipaludibacillus sp. CUR1]
MNLQQLDIFHRFSKSRSVTRVAKELGLKQPTITFHLKKLESDLGVKLYERVRDSIQLTAAGVTLNNYAGEIISLFNETERVMRDYQSSARGELFLGASHIPANYLLPPVFSVFTNEKPNIQLNVQVASTPTIIDLIKEKQLDIGIVSEQMLEDQALEIRRLVADDLALVIPFSHPLGKKDEIGLDDLVSEPFILHRSGSTREVINRWLKEKDLQLSIKMELTNIEAIRRMVMLNSGLSILSKRAVEEEATAGRVKTAEVPELEKNRYITLIYRKDRPITPVLQRFITELYKNL